jgi:hypothetical protein
MSHIPNIDLEDDEAWDEHHSEEEDVDETEPGGVPFKGDNY